MKEKELCSIAAQNPSVQLLFTTRGKAPNLSASGQRIHKQLPSCSLLPWYTSKQRYSKNKNCDADKITGSVYIFQEADDYVFPALQVCPLRSSTTNTVPKAFKNTLAWLHLPFEHAVGL